MSASHTIPLLRLLPGRPSRTFSCLTSFFGGIFLLLLAKRTVLCEGCAWTLNAELEGRAGRAGTKRVSCAEDVKAELAALVVRENGEKRMEETSVEVGE